jgi:polysaccharide biosynthesis protein PslJ
MNTQLYPLQIWLSRLDKHLYALMIGVILGILGGGVGLLVAVGGPVIAIAALAGAFIGLYVLTDLRVALYGILGIMIMLPFATLPFKIGFKPSFLDLALYAFLFVYVCLWMTGRRRGFQITPIHALIALYVMWVVFAFALGWRYGMPDATIARRFVMALVSISLTFILGDLLRDGTTLRRIVWVVTVFIGMQAVVATLLWAMPDNAADSLLTRLGRLGYPETNAIRYVESNPELGERAIGTWVDPNALGGLLAIGAAMLAPQLFAARPVLRPRWLTWGVMGVTVLALILTSSRASLLAFAVGLFVIILARYRRYLVPLIVVAILVMFLPPAQRYIDRIFQAFRGEDLATQMRVGEWTDALELISQYPLTGIGFTGTPNNTLYTDVANMYLIMANQIGLTGVALFLLAMGGVIAYGYKAWQIAKHDPDFDAILLGYHAALLTALVNAVADLYFFRLDFQASITWFWLTVTLALASSRLVLAEKEKRAFTLRSADPIKIPRSVL